MGRAVIRVRYRDQLPAGLNGKAELSARGTTVYLVPGLTGGQRRAALRRLRQEASRGCGPSLPRVGLTVALAADRLRAGLRNTAAVIRQHPAGSLLPAALAVLLMTLFVLASVGMAQLPQVVPGPPGSPGTPVSGSGAPTVVGGPAQAHVRGRHGGPSAPRAHAATGGGSGTQTTLVTSSSPGPGQVKHHKHGTVIQICGLAHGC